MAKDGGACLRRGNVLNRGRETTPWFWEQCGGELLPCHELMFSNVRTLNRGIERGRCVAGLFEDAAGEPGVLRSAGFALRSLIRIYQGSLAKALQPFAMMHSPFGTGVRWGGREKDCGSCLGGGNVQEVMREGVANEGRHGLIVRHSFMPVHFSMRHVVGTLALGAACLGRFGKAECMRVAECCLLRQGFEAQDGLGGPRSRGAGGLDTNDAMRGYL